MSNPSHVLTRTKSIYHPVVTFPRVRANAELVATVAGTANGSTRARLQAALEALQPLKMRRHADAVSVLAMSNPADEEIPALCALMAVPALPAGWKYSREEAAGAERKVNAALAMIGAADRQLLETITLLVGTIVFAKLDGYDGGSRTNVVGVIWVGLDSSKPVIDFADLIVHEFVHQCIFLDDMVRCVFPTGETELAVPEALVVSALRRTPRGYDKAYHSAFVALTLEAFHAALGDSRTGSMREAIHHTIEGLRIKASYLSDHGRRELESLGDVLSRFDAV